MVTSRVSRAARGAAENLPASNDLCRIRERNAHARREHYTALATEPAYEALVRAHDALFSARFLPNPALDTAMREAWRFQILTVAIHLHDTRDPADPRSGLTVGRLQHTLAGRGLASAGRIAAILKQLEAAGHLTARPSGVDRRMVLLMPTESLLAAIRLWEGVIFALIAQIARTGDQAHGWPAEARASPALGATMRRKMVEARLAGWSPLDGFPDIALFATRDGGWRLLSRMAALAVSPRDGGADGAVSIDLQAFARETGTSRSSLRRLLEDAWAIRLLDGPPRNGRTLLPARALVASFAAWLAMFVDAHRQFALAALAELADRPTAEA